MSADIEIVHSDEKYVRYSVETDDPAGWVVEAAHRGVLVLRMLALVAEYGEEEAAHAFGCAIVAQECRRRGLFRFGQEANHDAEG